jgi:hypothetical protein
MHVTHGGSDPLIVSQPAAGPNPEWEEGMESQGGIIDRQIQQKKVLSLLLLRSKSIFKSRTVVVGTAEVNLMPAVAADGVMVRQKCTLICPKGQEIGRVALAIRLVPSQLPYELYCPLMPSSEDDGEGNRDGENSDVRGGDGALVSAFVFDSSSK